MAVAGSSKMTMCSGRAGDPRWAVSGPLSVFRPAPMVNISGQTAGTVADTCATGLSRRRRNTLLLLRRIRTADDSLCGTRCFGGFLAAFHRISLLSPSGGYKTIVGPRGSLPLGASTVLPRIDDFLIKTRSRGCDDGTPCSHQRETSTGGNSQKEDGLSADMAANATPQINSSLPIIGKTRGVFTFRCATPHRSSIHSSTSRSARVRVARAGMWRQDQGRPKAGLFLLPD